MKLISLYIENFGGLHGFSLNFSEGLTTVCRPNGFGKTTLAEFIRAMFYGFPRKGRSLEKSPREKYTPWQGGVWGGNLVFSHEGHTYRLERTFGAVPKQDTFALIDQETGKQTRRFSENIGMELFGLDGESFARSVYLPQTAEKGSLTTAGIQAKLSNLVEDQEDIGNFDRAVAALKTARSACLPYRGTGGEVARAVEQLARLQEEETCLSARQAELERMDAELPGLQAQLEAHKRSRTELAGCIRQASADGLRREYGALVRRQEQLVQKRDALLARYESGMPTEQQLQQCQENLDLTRQLRRERTEILEILAGMPENRPGIGRILLWIAAVCGILTGAVLTAMELLPWAWAALAVGVLAGAGALVCRGRTGDRAKRSDLMAEAEEKARAAAEHETAAKVFLRKYSDASPLRETLRNICSDCREFRETEAALAAISREIAAFRRVHGEMLPLSTAAPGESLERMQEREQLLLERIEQLSATVAEQRRNRDLLVQDLSRLSSIREEKKRWQERLVRCRERAGLLDDTVNFLYQARENLQTGYLQPLRESFSGYMETLAGENGGGILMTPELEVQLERAGQSRRMGYFSAGQTDLVLLCMRFALVDALFARKRPVVILDDPFVNLDDAHLALALRMLQVLAEDRQILYMTCSESRSPK